MEYKIFDYSELKRLFLDPKNEYRNIPFCLLDGDITDTDNINKQLSALRNEGFGGVALQPDKNTIPSFGSNEYYSAIAEVIKCAQQHEMRVVLCDDSDRISGSFGGLLKKEAPEALSKILKIYEYTCDANEPVHRKLKQDGTTLSVVAMEVDTHEIIDLRDRSTGTYVDWNPPHGNWNILQFVCTDDPDSEHVNYLNYDASQKYVTLSHKRLTDKFPEFLDETVFMTFFRNIHYTTENRRMWDESFNRVFIELFDFDPAPFYPAMFYDIGEKTEKMRAMFMDCRAYMLEHGFFKAMADFSKAHGLRSAGYSAELKTISAPWLFGDGMFSQIHSGAAGVEMSHAYAYGINGLKLASSAAYNYDKSLVVCDIFGDYAKLDNDIIYREAMNVFARGVNCLLPRTYKFSSSSHIPHSVNEGKTDYRKELKSFNEFSARAQTLLRGGRHICDIALLYPIYSLESKTALFEFNTQSNGFEYPMPPSNADFMNIINTVMNYTCHDLTVLHPLTLHKRCYVEDGELLLSNDGNYEKYKLLILPASSMMSVKNLRTIKKLFDSGGKIIATGELPTIAFEYGEDAVSESLGESRSGEYPEQGSSLNPGHPLTPDMELEEHIRHIFGVTRDEINPFKPYYLNENEAGGKAYFIPASQTAADGTEMPDPQLFQRILDSLDIPFDVIGTDFPKVVNSGILNVSLPIFKAMNVHRGIKSGGMFNYIHRKNAGCDIFYFANSTNSDFNGSISLRGKLIPEEWNPHTGEINTPDYEYKIIKGETYTSIKSSINSAESMFYICRNYKQINNIT